MEILRRDKRKRLSELQGISYGTFRCDACKCEWGI
jgi:hypothetical protein